MAIHVVERNFFDCKCCFSVLSYLRSIRVEFLQKVLHQRDVSFQKSRSRRKSQREKAVNLIIRREFRGKLFYGTAEEVFTFYTNIHNNTMLEEERGNYSSKKDTITSKVWFGIFPQFIGNSHMCHIKNRVSGFSFGRYQPLEKIQLRSEAAWY